MDIFIGVVLEQLIRMSHTQKKGEGGTPAERKGSRQESEIKGDLIKMFTELKSDLKSKIRKSEKNIETKLEQMDKKIDVTKKIDESVNEIKGQMKEMTKRTQNL